MLVALGCAPTTIVNAEPTVRLTSPDAGEVLREGVPFHVVAATDDDAGSAALDVEWEISPEPETEGNALLAGDEASYYLENGLSEGEWDIRVTVSDYAGLSATDSMHLEIFENAKPNVRIRLPDEGEVYSLDGPLVVEVDVDAKDDEMSNIELFWGGVAEDAPNAPQHPPAEGRVIFYIENLSKGSAELIVTARDGGGADDTEQVSFTLR